MGNKDKKLEMDDLEPRARDVGEQEADEVTGGFMIQKTAKADAFAAKAKGSSGPISTPSISGQKRPGINLGRGPALKR